VPPELTAVLAALAVQASHDDFAAAERLLGGSFSGLADVRRNPVATIDAAELTGQEVTDQLSGLPIGQDAELHVAWIAERLGARMSFATFTANVGDLWFPAMDDIACVLYSAGQLLVLVLDHEEFITLSSLEASQAARHPGHKRRVRDGWPGSLDARFLALLALVRDGTGLRDARQLDLLVSMRFRPREGWTVLDELIELERRGFVRRAAGGTGYRWAISDAGSEALS
jgi:hypothetical protein